MNSSPDSLFSRRSNDALARSAQDPRHREPKSAPYFFSADGLVSISVHPLHDRLSRSRRGIPRAGSGEDLVIGCTHIHPSSLCPVEAGWFPPRHHTRHQRATRKLSVSSVTLSPTVTLFPTPPSSSIPHPLLKIRRTFSYCAPSNRRRASDVCVHSHRVRALFNQALSTRLAANGPGVARRWMCSFVHRVRRRVPQSYLKNIKTLYPRLVRDRGIISCTVFPSPPPPESPLFPTSPTRLLSLVPPPLHPIYIHHHAVSAGECPRGTTLDFVGN
jgi:hypothetical protein